MITLDNSGQFVTTEGKSLGVYVTQKRGRYQYRANSGEIYASGMTPAEFCKRFWYRDDFTDKVR